jgi:hypothetical protein
MEPVRERVVEVRVRAGEVRVRERVVEVRVNWVFYLDIERRKQK